MKPFKGEIYDWEKHDFPSKLYPDLVSLNFKIFGFRSAELKRLGTAIITSPVVSYIEIPRHAKEPRKIEIETLNSRYHLIGEGKGL